MRLHPFSFALVLVCLTGCSDAVPGVEPLDGGGLSDVGVDVAADADAAPDAATDPSDSSAPEPIDTSSPSDATSAVDVADAESLDTVSPVDVFVEPDVAMDAQEEDVLADLPDPIDPGPLAWDEVSESVELEGGGLFPAKADLDIYLPEAEGKYPVVVFSHGFQLSPSDYSSYGEHLASWGYVAILPSYPGSLIAPRSHAQLRDDLSAIVDWIEAEPAALKGRADTTLVGLSGHSMGGKVSLLFAATDPRADAVFAIDPVDAGPPFAFNPGDYPSVAPELMPDITAPLGIVGETTNSTGGGFGGACAPAEDNFQQYYQAATSPAVEIDMLGANHMSFLDDPNCGFACSACPAGTDDTVLTRKLTQRMMIAFFEVQLKGDALMTPWFTDWETLEPGTFTLVSMQSKNGF
jgi:predicted dienelactone hydrolase